MNPKKLIISGLLFLLSNFTTSSIAEEKPMHLHDQVISYEQTVQSPEQGNVQCTSPEIIAMHDGASRTYFGNCADTFFVYTVLQSEKHLVNMHNKLLQVDPNLISCTRISNDTIFTGALVDIGGFVSLLAEKNSTLRKFASYNELLTTPEFALKHPGLANGFASQLIKSKEQNLFLIKFPMNQVSFSSWASLYLRYTQLHASFEGFIKKQAKLSATVPLNIHIGYASGLSSVNAINECILLLLAGMTTSISNICVHVPNFSDVSLVQNTLQSMNQYTTRPVGEALELIFNLRRTR